MNVVVRQTVCQTVQPIRIETHIEVMIHVSGQKRSKRNCI